MGVVVEQTEQRAHRILAALTNDPRCAYVHHVDQRDAVFDELTTRLAPGLVDLTTTEPLWQHQAEAIDAVLGGSSVVVTSKTASGKSRIYQLCVAQQSVENNEKATALVVVPTKALAGDQLRGFIGYEKFGITAATYDGDCTTQERQWVRSHANTILTNPEMLHFTMMPNHKQWATFFLRLKTVVIDEAHQYRGVFGSHMAHIIRRIRRIARLYGAEPTFIINSATLREPEAFAEKLTGISCVHIGSDGSPQSEKDVVMWNPQAMPTTPKAPKGTAVHPDFTPEVGDSPSMFDHVVDLSAMLIDADLTPLIFSPSRKSTEVTAQRLTDVVSLGGAKRVEPYRGGYLTSERRTIEDDLANGELSAVVATSAFELGLDIAAFDAVVLSGIPTTMSSLHQQLGRVGRRDTYSLAIVVGGDDQLDQWFLANAEVAFQRDVESIVINPYNETIADAHIRAAAFEKPLTHDDHEFWGEPLDDAVRRAVQSDNMRIVQTKSGPNARVAGESIDQRTMSLRGHIGGEVSIVDSSDTLVGTVELAQAQRTVHCGAVYVHHGKHYEVLEFAPDQRRARVALTNGEHRTQVSSVSDVEIQNVERTGALGPIDLLLVDVEVTSNVTGYRLVRNRDGSVLARHKIESEPQRLETRGIALVMYDDVIFDAELDSFDPSEEANPLGGALHAIEHCCIGSLPLLGLCDRSDVGGLSTISHPDTLASTIIIHERFPGGLGIAEEVFQQLEQVLSTTASVIEGCSCSSGCPKCIQSPKCGNFNEPLHKAGALRLLTAMLGNN